MENGIIYIADQSWGWSGDEQPQLTLQLLDARIASNITLAGSFVAGGSSGAGSRPADAMPEQSEANRSRSPQLSRAIQCLSAEQHERRRTGRLDRKPFEETYPQLGKLDPASDWLDAAVQQHQLFSLRAAPGQLACGIPSDSNL